MGDTGGLVMKEDNYALFNTKVILKHVDRDVQKGI